VLLERNLREKIEVTQLEVKREKKRRRKNKEG